MATTQIEKATPFNQGKLDLTQKQIDSMSQEDWDKLPIVTGGKPGGGGLAAEKAAQAELERSDIHHKEIKKSIEPLLVNPVIHKLGDIYFNTPKKIPQPVKNTAIKLTRGLLKLLSPTVLPGFRAARKIYGGARTIHSKLNKWKIDKRDAAREYKPPYSNR